MTLTQDDLRAIQLIVQTTVKPMIDEAVGSLAQSTAAGFTEVHERIDTLETTLSKRIQAVDDGLQVKDGKLEDTVLRVDNIEIQLPNFKPRIA